MEERAPVSTGIGMYIHFKAVILLLLDDYMLNINKKNNPYSGPTPLNKYLIYSQQQIFTNQVM